MYFTYRVDVVSALADDVLEQVVAVEVVAFQLLGDGVIRCFCLVSVMLIWCFERLDVLFQLLVDFVLPG